MMKHKETVLDWAIRLEKPGNNYRYVTVEELAKFLASRHEEESLEKASNLPVTR